jgi:K+-sensing histidine kinase KdpD
MKTRGMGMCICRMTIGRHGGELSAVSGGKDKDALFQFILHVKPAASPAAATL